MFNIEDFAAKTKARRAANGLCVHYLRFTDGQSSIYAACDEADKQSFIAKLNRDGDTILSC